MNNNVTTLSFSFMSAAANTEAENFAIAASKFHKAVKSIRSLKDSLLSSSSLAAAGLGLNTENHAQFVNFTTQAGMDEAIDYLDKIISDIADNDPANRTPTIERFETGGFRYTVDSCRGWIMLERHDDGSWVVGGQMDFVDFRPANGRLVKAGFSTIVDSAVA